MTSLKKLVKPVAILLLLIFIQSNALYFCISLEPFKNRVPKAIFGNCVKGGGGLIA